MLLFFIITALVVLCIPITVSSRSLAEAEGSYIIQNIALRPLPSFALRIELEGGKLVLSRNNKSRSMGQKKQKAEVSLKKREIPFELTDLKPVRLRELSVRGSFGGDNAMQTALFCAGVVNMVHLVYKFLPKAERFSTNILPDYSKPGLQITINLSFQFNLLLIFFIFFSILFRKIKKDGVKYES